MNAVERAYVKFREDQARFARGERKFPNAAAMERAVYQDRGPKRTDNVVDAMLVKGLF